MYRYDEFDARFVAERVEQFRGTGRAPALGRTDRGPVQAAAADERALSAAPRLHAAHRRALRDAGRAAAAHARAHRAQIRQGLRPFHHAAEHPVQLAEARRCARHPGRSRHASRCTRSRPAATASATSRPIISRAPRPTRSRTRARSRRSSANGRSLHPEFSFLPRKFKIAVIGTRARPRRAEVPRHGRRDREERRRARPDIKCSSAAAWDARLISAMSIGDFVAKPDILAFLESVMRVYNEEGRRDNLYKARIKILANALGPEEMRRRRWWSSRRSAKAARSSCRARNSTASTPISRRRPSRRFPTRCQAGDADFRELGEDERLQRIARRATPSPRSRLKPIGGVPGDATHEQMDALAELMDQFRHRRNPRHPRAEPRPAACEEARPARRSMRG